MPMVELRPQAELLMRALSTLHLLTWPPPSPELPASAGLAAPISPSKLISEMFSPQAQALKSLTACVISYLHVCFSPLAPGAKSLFSSPSSSPSWPVNWPEWLDIWWHQLQGSPIARKPQLWTTPEIGVGLGHLSKCDVARGGQGNLCIIPLPGNGGFHRISSL